jgi:hypothetical protein
MRVISGVHFGGTIALTKSTSSFDPLPSSGVGIVYLGCFIAYNLTLPLWLVVWIRI